MILLPITDYLRISHFERQTTVAKIIPETIEWPANRQGNFIRCKICNKARIHQRVNCSVFENIGYHIDIGVSANQKSVSRSANHKSLVILNKAIDLREYFSHLKTAKSDGLVNHHHLALNVFYYGSFVKKDKISYFEHVPRVNLDTILFHKARIDNYLMWVTRLRT